MEAAEERLSSSQILMMANLDSEMNSGNSDVPCQQMGGESMEVDGTGDSIGGGAIDGRSMFGYSLTSPDLVICAGSPDIPRDSYGNSPESLENDKCSTELSLENGIDGSCNKGNQKTPAVKFSTVCQTFGYELSPESSFELPSPPDSEGHFLKDVDPVISINAGSTYGGVTLGNMDFMEDDCFTGGDTIRTAAMVGNGDGIPLYQTARYGNFSYKFQSLEPGKYFIDLHFAELVFTDGPTGIRVFNVYIQEEKVISCLDIFSQVGGNKPLVISDLWAFVECKELSIRFEGVMGSAIVSGISVRKDASAGNGKVGGQDIEATTEVGKPELPEGEIDSMAGEEYQRLRRDYECQKKELAEIKRVVEELKRENQVKNKECQEAWNSLQDLQNELMRKSMHVGSLAFAIEGQVKEKSRWFSSLRDLTRKLKIMKMEQIKLYEDATSYKKLVSDVNEMSCVIRMKMNQKTELHEDLKNKFAEGEIERKELYNKILELKGNIRVFCRCRPFSTSEIGEGASTAIDFEYAKDGELTILSNGAPKKTFKFDSIFGPQASQANVFEDTAPFATSVLDGYNVCIFAYGQTGTGKTFTMEGTEENRGVNYRTLEELFRIIKDRENLYRYEMSVSVLEVYNEQIRDLLLVSGPQTPGTPKRLEIRQVGEGQHHVPGLVEAQVKNINEVWEVLKTGGNARAVGSTNANEHSSRSHCIHRVMVKGENLLNGECTRSKLWLVDLAGSERVAKTEVQGERLKETQNINRSLSALGDVISALATKSPHIPFRNSKLTHLLQDSLGGDSKTLMFVQISPNEKDLSETLCSLNFASRVRGIELGPPKRQLESSELWRYKLLVEKAKQDMKSKDAQVKNMEETIYGLESKIKERDLRNKNLQEKVKELESQLLIERKLARQHVDTKIAEQHQQQPAKQPYEDQNVAPSRPPLANRVLGSNKNSNEPASGAVMKEIVGLTRPLMENGCKPPVPSPFPPSESLPKNIDHSEKENNPNMAEQPRIPKRTGRTSICMTAKRAGPAPVSRRNSLAPLSSIPNSITPITSTPSQLGKQGDECGAEHSCLPEHTHSPKGMKSGNRMLSTILRRSLHKKMQMRSPRQQHLRRGGINVGMEKVRVSIGSRGRLAHRVLLNNARRAGPREAQQKQSQKEKERGWI